MKIIPSLKLELRVTQFVVMIAIGSGAGCAGIQSVESNVNKEESMSFEVAVERRVLIKKEIKTVFDFITAEDVLPKVLTGYGLLPGVTHTSQVSGPWDVPNATRIVHLADGTTVREQMLARKPSESFSYRVWEFGNPIVAALATGANGDWTFKSVPAGTEVRWTYTFKAKNALAAMPLSVIARLAFRGYMDVCLANTAKYLE